MYRGACGIVLLSMLLVAPAWAFHGYAFRIGGGERELMIYFDPDAGNSGDWEYLASPSKLLTSLAGFARDNKDAISAFDSDYQVFVSFDGEQWTYVVERVDGELSSVSVAEIAAGTPEESLLKQVLCVAPLNLDCGPAEENTEEIVLLDGIGANEIPEFPSAAVEISDALVSFGPMGAGLEASVVVLPTTQRANIEALVPSEAIQIGPAIELLDKDKRGLLFDTKFLDEDRTQNENRDEPGPLESSVYNPVDRSGSPNGDKLDSRLRFLVLHCTAGRLSREAVLKLKGKSRGKGHVYIMPDGELISIWAPTTNPNTVLATKTELQQCSTTRPSALRSMYHIELNYPCHWKPSESPDPSAAQFDAAAEHIVDLFNEYGPFHILAHTYVDMGINSRFAHTDPQGKGGFNYDGLYAKIESQGVNLSGITKVEGNFAKRYPISQGHIQHQFPPGLNSTLPNESASKPDACRWPGK